LTAVTKAAFARLHGVSRQAVNRWTDEGYLSLTAAGLVDVEESDHRLDGARLGKFSLEDDERGEPQSIDEFLASLLEGKSGTKAAAGQVKDSALAGLRALEFQKKAGALIPLDEAQTTFFECARGFRDALLAWPGQTGPLIAADLDLPAGRVTEVLETHVRDLLAGLGEPELQKNRPVAGGVDTGIRPAAADERA
jgi:hypothetical protein